MKINQLEIENVKKIKIIELNIDGKNLIIGGENLQGKTSFLDAICYALGGEKYKPSKLQRENAEKYAKIKIITDNGLLIERSGKNSSLKVTDQNGIKAGQSLLKSFISEFALNVQKFLSASNIEKKNILLDVLGLKEILEKMQNEAKKIYEDRHASGRIADSKKKYAEELPYNPDVPDVPIRASELIKQQQAILLRNAENEKKRQSKKEIENNISDCNNKLDMILQSKKQKQNEIDKLLAEIKELDSREIKGIEIKRKLQIDLSVCKKTITELQDESTAEIEKKINEIEEINNAIRNNQEAVKAKTDADIAKSEWNEKDVEYKGKIKEINNLLNSAKFPLAGLKIQDEKLLYNNQEWDCMSGSEQLKVSTAIVKKLQPNCNFILLDKLEQFDNTELKKFCRWCDENDMQIIGTRVSTGEECSIIIENGVIKENYIEKETKQITETKNNDLFF